MNAPLNTQQHDVAPLDLGKAYQMNSACGFAGAVTLSDQEAENLAGRLRAIQAVAGVLIACDGTGATLGECLRHGLVEAVHLLSLDSLCDLEHANDRAVQAIHKGVSHA